MAEQVVPDEPQSFRVARPPAAALTAATAYLEGVGTVSPALAGRLERHGDALVVHHGRLRTRIEAAPEGQGSAVLVERTGKAPLEDNRRALYIMGLLGTVVAWGLAVYNQRAAQPFNPLVTLAIFFAALVAVSVVLYVVDRSIERRVSHLLLALEDAMRGDPLRVLQREVEALERNGGLVNAILFYCAAILLEFVIFAILLSNDIRQFIDEELTLRVMGFGFLLPVVPAVLFGLLWWYSIHRVHSGRLQILARRPGATA